MTQILNLPQFNGAASTVTVSENGDWRDSVLFSAPGSPAYSVATGAIVTGSAAVTGLTTDAIAAIAHGQVVTGYGIPAGATIVDITSTTSFTLSAVATATEAVARMSFQPIPLDLTGIAFRSQVRDSVGSPVVLLDLSTVDGTLANGGVAGTLSFAVPAASLKALRARFAAQSKTSGVFDILAIADGVILNLFQSGPASIMVASGVTVQNA